MKIAAIIQARMGSKRLPGKVMKKIGNKLIIEYIIEKLSKIKGLEKTIISTSKNSEDDKIANFCKKKNILFYRGSVNNVAKRLLDTAKTNKLDAFIRISGDSPLLLQSIIKKGINLYKNNDYDIVTNVFPRSFPKGQSIEIINLQVLKKTIHKMSCKQDKEHVTTYFYKNNNKYKIFNFLNKKKLDLINLSIDTIDDLKMIKLIISDINKKNLNHSLKNYIDAYKKYE